MSQTSKDKKLACSATSESLPEGIKRSLVDDKPKRRVFEPEYKLEILERLEECRGKRGAVGELLRQEGLYAAQVAGAVAIKIRVKLLTSFIMESPGLFHMKF